MSDAQKLAASDVMIVGGAGFVGSNLVRMILDSGDAVQITIVDNLLSSERANITNDPRVHFIEGSIADDKIVSSLKDKYDAVFHLATFHGNQNSIFDPIRDHQNNTLTTLKLFECLKNFKRLRKVVYSSAGCSVAKKTFDHAEATTEDSPIEIRQDSPYSISKIIGEFYSVYYYKQHSLPTVRARFQNVYGPGEILGAGEWRGTYATVWRNVIPTFVYKALKGEPLPVENNGEASRDFVFVDDICRGLLACAASGAPGEVYNLGSGRETTIRDLAETINRMTANKAALQLLPKRAWDNSGKRFASTEKAFAQLNFSASVSMEMGLSKTIEWTRQNLELIERTIKKHQKEMSKIGS